MKSLLSLGLLLTCAGPSWAAPKEQSGPKTTVVVPTGQVAVAPVFMTPAGLNPGIIAGQTIPAASAGAKTLALPAAAAGAQGKVSAAANADAEPGEPKTQTASDLPPKGPPTDPKTEEGGGGPPGPPGGPGNGDGPAPGPGGAQNKSALAQLRAELSVLQKQLSEAKGDVEAASVMGREYKGGAGEASGRAHERVTSIKAKIDAKKAEIKTARSAEKAHYEALKHEVSVLKKERDLALAEASSVSSLEAAEFKGKGGADEIRGRALEKAARVELEIESRREQLRFIERENPGFAGVLAPLVVVKNALGFAPRSAEEKRLRQEISKLERERSDLLSTSYRAQNGVHELPEKTVGEITEAIHKRVEAIETELAAKKKELNSLPSPISASGEERRLASEIAALDKEQQRLETSALRILAGQKDAPSADAVGAAQQAQRRAAEIRGEIELKRSQLRQSRTISRR